jgi:hypothetical protein
LLQNALHALLQVVTAIAALGSITYQIPYRAAETI